VFGEYVHWAVTGVEVRLDLSTFVIATNMQPEKLTKNANILILSCRTTQITFSGYQQ
jgi:hypothetical protein